MMGLRQSIVASLRGSIGGHRAIVFLPRTADAAAWELLLREADIQDVLLLALDDDKILRAGQRQPVLGVTSHLQLQHEIIDGLTSGTPVNSIVQRFDPNRRAIVLAPDPLDVTSAGGRQILSTKPAATRLGEHKTIIDSLWELAGIDHAEAVVCDLSPRLPAIIRSLGYSRGVVLSCEHRGAGPHAGGEGLWWTTNGKLPPSFPALGSSGIRLRIMPLLHGLPCRIHGMASGGETIVFPPLELISLPRPATGTFFWAGAVPVRTLDATVRTHLHAFTVAIGTWLTTLGFSGAFAVDGIWTPAGYRPTELTPRLTSAFEGAKPIQRVMLHAANMTVRSGQRLVDPSALASLAEEALADRIDVYGASPTATSAGRYPLAWTSSGPRLNGTSQARGSLALSQSLRGWSLHARLHPEDLPADQPVGVLAPEIFKLSDEVFGTQFGELAPPFGLHPIHVPRPREPSFRRDRSAHPTWSEAT